MKKIKGIMPINRTTVPFLLFLIFAFLLFLGISASADEVQVPGAKITDPTNAGEAKVQIEAERYTYTYEAVPTPSEDKTEIYYIGKITIRDEGNNIFYEEMTGLDPRSGMCDTFPMVSKRPVKIPADNKSKSKGAKNNRWIVVFCGSSEGRHQTLKIFLKEGGVTQVKSTSLDFQDTRPNLVETDSGSGYVAKVYRRVLFPGIASGLQNCLMVYLLHIDDGLSGGNYFGFIPVFGPEMAKPYLDYYMQQKEWLRQKAKKETPEDMKITFNVNAGSILSALIATQDKKIICSEIKNLNPYGLTVNGLQAWIKRINDLGYPEFDINICKEDSK
jgi:hypothetical protein